MKMKKVLITAIIFLLIFNLQLLAAEDSLIIKTSYLVRKDDIIESTNGITIVKGDVEIDAEHGLYYRDEKKAEMSGNVVLLHNKGEISSQRMTAWINEDRYIFNEEVLMLQNLDDGQFNLKSKFLELMKEDNSFTARQDVIIEYNERTLKGDEVLYNDQEQTLELISNVYIEEENGDWVRSERALFDLETEEFTAEGNVELEIDITSD